MLTKVKVKPILKFHSDFPPFLNFDYGKRISPPYPWMSPNTSEGLQDLTRSQNSWLSLSTDVCPFLKRPPGCDQKQQWPLPASRCPRQHEWQHPGTLLIRSRRPIVGVVTLPPPLDSGIAGSLGTNPLQLLRGHCINNYEKLFQAL